MKFIFSNCFIFPLEHTSIPLASKSSIISTCSSYHISEILALTIFSTRLRAIRSIFAIRVTLSRRIISWMQNKSFIRSTFRNRPSDLQIRKPAVLLSDNGVNRIVFHFTPITTGNIFSRKKLLTSPCQILFHSHFLFSQALTLRQEQPHLHFLPFVRIARFAQITLM